MKWKCESSLVTLAFWKSHTQLEILAAKTNFDSFFVLCPIMFLETFLRTFLETFLETFLNFPEFSVNYLKNDPKNILKNIPKNVHWKLIVKDGTDLILYHWIWNHFIISVEFTCWENPNLRITVFWKNVSLKENWIKFFKKKFKVFFTGKTFFRKFHEETFFL